MRTERRRSLKLRKCRVLCSQYQQEKQVSFTSQFTNFLLFPAPNFTILNYGEDGQPTSFAASSQMQGSSLVSTMQQLLSGMQAPMSNNGEQFSTGGGFQQVNFGFLF